MPQLRIYFKLAVLPEQTGFNPLSTKEANFNLDQLLCSGLLCVFPHIVSTQE